MLILCLDASKKSNVTVYAIIAIEEKYYGKVYSMLVGKLGHFKELSNKKRYLVVFERRFNKIKNILYYYGCFIRFNSVLRIIDLFAAKSKLIIVDDKFYTLIKSKYGSKVIAEGKVKPYYSVVVLLTDNLANLVRIKLSKAKSALERYRVLEKYRKK